eukprot:410226_1
MLEYESYIIEGISDDENIQNSDEHTEENEQNECEESEEEYIELTDEEQALIDEFEAVNNLSIYTKKLKKNRNNIAYLLDHPKRVKDIIEHCDAWYGHGNHKESMNISYFDNCQMSDTFSDWDEEEDFNEQHIECYEHGTEIIKQWFKQNNPLDIIIKTRNEINKDNVLLISDIVNNIVKEIYNLELQPYILHEIENFSLIINQQPNIIQIDEKTFCGDLYEKQIKDMHWIENNLLNNLEFDITNSFFTKYFEKNQYKNHNSIQSNDYDDDLWDNQNTQLTNGCISCGDIIYVSMSCSDYIQHEISHIYYIIGRDNKTMKRIGITGNYLSYIYGNHIVIPFSVTSIFFDPLQTYLQFMHIMTRENIQIELQISNKCNVFNENATRKKLSELKRNQILSHYPWNTNSEKTHRYKYNVMNMSGGKDESYCTIYIDIYVTDNIINQKRFIFGYCNNDEIQCINLSMLNQNCLNEYIVKYKGEKMVPSLCEEEVNKLLLDLDDTIDVDEISKCLKKGIANHLIKMDENKGLNTVILNSKCDNCNNNLICTIKDVLYQENIGADLYGPNSNERIERQGCKCGNVVAGMCTGDIRIEPGECYHHCDECENMGICLNSHTQGHCFNCGQHYFWGRTHELNCDKCGPGGFESH